MIARTTDPATADQDAVMGWLQDREMKDHGLADARSGIGGHAIISSIVGRIQEKAYAAFPHIDRNAIDSYVRQYVDPAGRSRSRDGA